jgi:hypothetical protein
MKDPKGHGSNAHSAGIAKLPSMVNVRELTLYADNDANLYRQSRQPIEANLERKLANGSYDHGLAAKLWGYHADKAAQAYHQQFGSRDTKWHEMFSPSDRRAAASHWAEAFRSERK